MKMAETFGLEVIMEKYSPGSFRHSYGRKFEELDNAVDNAIAYQALNDVTSGDINVEQD